MDNPDQLLISLACHVLSDTSRSLKRHQKSHPIELQAYTPIIDAHHQATLVVLLARLELNPG